MLARVASIGVIERPGPRGGSAPMNAPPGPIYRTWLPHPVSPMPRQSHQRPQGVLVLVARAPAQVLGTQ